MKGPAKGALVKGGHWLMGSLWGLGGTSQVRTWSRVSKGVPVIGTSILGPMLQGINKHNTWGNQVLLGFAAEVDWSNLYFASMKI